MTGPRIAATRTSHELLPDRRRVLARPFLPGEDALAGGRTRAGQLMDRVLELPEEEAARALAGVLERFSARHGDFEGILERNFGLAAHHLPPGAAPGRGRRLLIGAFFTAEYAVEAAALFNPSMVPAADQRGLPPGHLRFVMSVRAVGEGHISSIEFRTGTLDARCGVSFDPPGTMLVAGTRTAPERYDRHLFRAKIGELGAGSDIASGVLDRLPDRFTPAELEGALAVLEKDGAPTAVKYETLKIMRILAASNYVTRFPAGSALPERVLFPAGPNETRGMEDARFVRFTEEDGSATWYATYTAYDGFQILPQLIETPDFSEFRVATLNGSAAQNKGMALFPRRVGGKYLMLSRKDRENLHLAASDEVRFWNESREFRHPTRSWELLQIGNCGSPIETGEGWLVITHGVGAMRRYSIGAMLLDLEEPWRVIGALREPLLEPDGEEREGYVPNVVYSCGGLVHGGTLVLPYGFSDRGIHVAQVRMEELLGALRG